MLTWIEFFTHLLNHWFAAPVDAVLTALGIHLLHPSHPINNTLTEELMVFAIMVVFFIVVRLALSVEKPGNAQHLAELAHEFVDSQAEQVMGHGHESHLPVLTCILVFILLLNCMGLLPGVETPTANPVVPFGLAIFTFFYYNWMGLRKQGPVHYVKHFMGPVWWIAPLMFPIEIISHIARMLSLTVRLFANMLASDLITVIFFSMFPLALPIIGLGLHAFVALIQAYIFMLLATIYVGEATAHVDEASI
ncbi:MAG TPA: F0F1 ATP synthase subunit A [Acidobacteriaceae bacterium]|jgi:F-type H+-transporting ATPase subunit a|nr:F0F1 ATP synthase subunit A [Acidobacteriaceae bacterium]